MKRSRLKPVSDARRAEGNTPRGSTLARRTPLPAESAKRKGENRVRYGPTKEALYERARGGCEVAGVIGMHDYDARACLGRLEQHEVLTRARGGSITDPSNQLLACAFHHHWITTHPRIAAELGLVRHSWDRP